MVTPLGVDVMRTWEGVCAGRNAVGPIERFDASGFPVTFAAEVRDPGPVSSSTLDRIGEHSVEGLKERLALTAAQQALKQAALPTGLRVGVSLGSEAARPSLGTTAERLISGELPSPDQVRRLAPSWPTELVARLAGAHGPQVTVSTACTSSSQAVGEGVLRLRRGEVDAMIVGGVDVLVDPIMLTGFSLLGALSTRNEEPARASRPFDLGRDGFVLGEGAGFLVIETLQGAEARGAELWAEISGWGCSCNAYRITDSPPDGRGASQAMSAALADAGLEPSELGYVNAHGTSTPMNDASEARAVHRTLGSWADRVPVSSTKSEMGHLVAACGAVELIIAGMAVRTNRVPPTRNLERVDPACALLHVREQYMDTPVDHALTNAFGFGGSNGSLVISEAPR
jgi:3-oxoacyl-[acyl-carrier-protein] synthase II